MTTSSLATKGTPATPWQAKTCFVMLFLDMLRSTNDRVKVKSHLVIGSSLIVWVCDCSRPLGELCYCLFQHLIWRRFHLCHPVQGAPQYRVCVYAKRKKNRSQNMALNKSYFSAFVIVAFNMINHKQKKEKSHSIRIWSTSDTTLHSRAMRCSTAAGTDCEVNRIN